MTKAEPLNFRQYWDEVGTDNVRRIIERLESSMAYARLIKYGFKTPGHAWALRFIDAARDNTPGFEPDLELMLRGVPRQETSSRGKLIQPSPRFLAAQSRAKRPARTT